MEAIRADAFAIRILTAVDPRLGQECSRWPVVDLRPVPEDALPGIRSDSMDHAPWSRATVMPARQKWDEDGRLFGNVAVMYWPSGRDNFILVGVFAENAGGRGGHEYAVFAWPGSAGDRMSLVCGLHCDANGKEEAYGDDDRSTIQLLVQVVSGAIRGIAYLSQCQEHLVEVFPCTPPTADEKKTAVKKPWLRRHYPRVILLTPESASTVGHRIDRGGTHEKPAAHQRRGHWATLRHEKFRRKEDGKPVTIWRKEAWIGKRTWEHQGNTYRVITEHRHESK